MCGAKVVVGIDDSLGSLEALRHAVDEARRRGAELAVVHVMAYEERVAMTAAEQEAAGRQYAEARFTDAMGGRPGDVPVVEYLRLGEPAPVLCHLASDHGDLLVVGAARPRRPWRAHRSVTRRCLRRAACPVLVVPPSRLARELRGRRRRWRGLDELLAAGPGDGRLPPPAR